MSDVDEVNELVDAVRPFFAGRDPDIIGAALADLLATWLAGHALLDDDGGIQREATKQMRTDILEAHVASLDRLVEINEIGMWGFGDS